MINLLPENSKKQIRAARANAILVKYIFTVLAAAAFIGLLLGASYYILQSSKTAAENSIVKIQTGNSSYSPVSSKSSGFTNDLVIARKIIDQQISYSKILEELAKALPSGTVLKSPFQISPNSLNVPITFEAYMTDSSDESTLKMNLESNPIFSNYSMQSLNSNEDSGAYPYLITFNVTINGAMLK